VKKYLLLLIPVVLISMNSCKKIGGHEIVPSSAGTGATGSTGSTGSTGATGSTGSTGSSGGATMVDTTKGYQPAATGNYWKYAESGSYVDTSLQKVTGTTTINNKLYSVITAQSILSGNQTWYLSDINHTYTERATVQGNIIEILYLKDNVAVGTTWTAPASDNGIINGVPAQVSGVLVGKNLSKTVSGKTYANVIHTTILLQYNYGVGFTTSATYDYYIANGIGIIETDASLTLPGAPPTATTTAIISYSIK